MMKASYNNLMPITSTSLTGFEEGWMDACRRDRAERRVRMEEKKERKRRRKKRKRRER